MSRKRYEFLEDIAIADVAFKAYGQTLEELFENAAEATFEVMVETSGLDVGRGKWEVRLKGASLDDLLYDFLSEIIALKDEKGVVLGKFEVGIEKTRDKYELTAQVYGDKIDPKKYKLLTDVKAVTLHLFGIKETVAGYEATVVLDV